MAIPIANIIERLRSSADFPIDQAEFLSQDGTQYTVRLGFKPIISGSDEVYVSHTTFTTGLNQYVPRNGTQSLSYSSGVNLVYAISYPRGELYFYRGSGYNINSTGLLPFAPWSTSTVSAYYQSSKYTDKALSDHISFAVAGVEGKLQLGMYVSGVSGIAPRTRQYTDSISYFTNTPYAADEKMIIAEDVEIIQDLITMKAALDLLARERRVGAGDAIRLKDGDTEVDTAGGQRYVMENFRDMKLAYDKAINNIILQMSNGYNIRQINENSPIQGIWDNGTYYQG